jgi:UDPglucose 6-dehydrogenase
LEGVAVSKIGIIGLGYVGLTTALGLTKLGHEVIGVDTNLSRLESLKNGKIPIYEPGLDDELRDSLGKGRLTFSPALSDATESCDIFFVCVSTPSDESGAADLSFVFAVCADLSRSANPNSIIVLKSTVPVGTGEKLGLATQSLCHQGILPDDCRGWKASWPRCGCSRRLNSALEPTGAPQICSATRDVKYVEA